MPDRPDLEAIRKRVEAASSGPWMYHVLGFRVYMSNTFKVVADCGADGHPGNVSGNRDFIAASREDMPALLAYIAELEAVVLPVAAMEGVYCDCPLGLSDASHMARGCPVAKARALNIPPTRSPA